MDELGLTETVPGNPDQTQLTALGKELNTDLVMVSIGLWDYLEVPIILEERGLSDEFEADQIYERLEGSETPEHVLRPFVQKAHQMLYNIPGSLC